MHYKTILLSIFCSFFLLLMAGCDGSDGTGSSGDSGTGGGSSVFPQLIVRSPSSLCYIPAAGDTSCHDINLRFAALVQATSPVRFLSGSAPFSDDARYRCLFTDRTEFSTTTFEWTESHWIQRSGETQLEPSNSGSLIFYRDHEGMLRSRSFLSEAVIVEGDITIRAEANPECGGTDPDNQIRIDIDSGILTIILDDDADDWLKLIREIAEQHLGVLWETNRQLNDLPSNAVPAQVAQDLKSANWEVVYQGSAPSGHKLIYSEGMLFSLAPDKVEFFQFHNTPVRVTQIEGGWLLETLPKFRNKIKIVRPDQP